MHSQTQLCEAESASLETHFGARLPHATQCPALIATPGAAGEGVVCGCAHGGGGGEGWHEDIHGQDHFDCSRCVSLSLHAALEGEGRRHRWRQGDRKKRDRNVRVARTQCCSLVVLVVLQHLHAACGDATSTGILLCVICVSITQITHILWCRSYRTLPLPLRRTLRLREEAQP